MTFNRNEHFLVSYFLILSLTLSGLFAELDHQFLASLLIFIGLLLLTAKTTLSSKSRSQFNTLSKNQPKPSSKTQSQPLSSPSQQKSSFFNTLNTFLNLTPLQWFYFLIAITPSLLRLFILIPGEFPFSGDHDHHVFAGLSSLEFWKSWFWLPVLIFTTIPYQRKSQFIYARWIPIVIFFIIGIISLFSKSPPFYFARYPGLSYTLTSPLHWIQSFLKMGTPHHVHIIFSFLSLPAWLLILRPLTIGKKIDEQSLLFCLLFYWQADTTYYQTSTYLEPWSFIFLLIAAENLFRLSDKNSEPNLITPLFICLACLTKETSALWVPFFFIAEWIVCHLDTQKTILGSIFKYKNEILKWSYLRILILSPFLFYLRFRTSENVWRQSDLQIGFDSINTIRINEWIYRFLVQWGWQGLFIITVFTFGMIGAYIYHFNFKKRWTSAVLGSGVLLISAFYFFDQNSNFHIGYPRFHLPIYLILFSGVFLLNCKPLFKPKTIFFIIVFQLIGVGPEKLMIYRHTSHNVGHLFEHYDSPFYFPIRHLIEKANLHSPLNFSPDIQIHSPISNLYPQSLAVGYQDLALKTRFIVTPWSQQTECGCLNFPNRIQIYLSHPKVELWGNLVEIAHLSSPPSIYKKTIDKRVIESCLAQAQRSCQNTIASDDFEPFGFIAWGKK